MKLLVVDDKKDNRYLLETMLSGNGFKVRTAANGIKALEKLRQEHFDLIIADILMPEMDGYQLCRECKKDKKLKNIPFIFYTAPYTDPKDEEFALSLGADRYIRKPAEPEAFIRIIRQVIQETEKPKKQPKKPALKDKAEVFKLYSQRLVKKLEDKMLDLESSETRYRALFEATGTATLLVNEDTTIEMANQEVKNVTGYNPDELTGKKWTEFVTPESLELMKKYHQLWRKDPEKAPKKYEVKLVNKKGQTRNALLDITLIPGTTQSVVSILDITDRKQAEERYTSLISNLPVGVFRSTPEGQLLSANPAMAKIYGFDSIEGLLQASATNFYVDKQTREKMLNDLENKNLLTDYPTLEKKKDGTPIWVSTKYKAIRDDKGKIKYIDGVAIDITERKRSEDKFRIIFESAPDAHYLSDLKGTFIDGNRAAERLTGYNKKEIIGKSFLELNLLPINQRPKAAAILAKNKLGKPTGPDEITLKRKDGTRVESEISTHPVKIEGKKLVLGIARDITARKKQDKEYKQLIDSMNDTAFVIDFKGKFIEVNEAAVRVLGYTKEELVNMGPAGLDPYLSADKIKELIDGMKSDERQVFETQHQCKNGKIIPVEISSSPITFQGNAAILSIARDITERKQREKERKMQYTFQQLRADLWQTAFGFQGSESELIRDMLNIVGPALDVSRATFLRIDSHNREYVVESQWHTEQAGPSKNRSISFQKVKLLAGRQYAELPKDLVPGIKQYATRKIKKDDILSYLAVPYGDEKNPAGLFTFAECRQKRQWSKVEINTLLEIVNIITLKSKQMEALRIVRENETRLKEAQAQGRIGSWEFDLGTNSITWSDETYRLYERDPALGPPMPDEEAEYYPPNQAKKLREYASRVIKEGQSFQYDLQAQLPSGRIVFFTANMQPVKDSSGKIIRLHGTVQDITERKRAEQALKESEARYRTIFENTGVPTVIIEKDTTLSFANRQFEQLSNYTKEEIENKKSWTEFVVEEDLEKMKGYHRARRKDPTAAPNQYEFRFHDRHGTVKNILLTIAMIPGTQKSVASMLDMTEQRQLEKQLRQAQKLEAVGQLTGGVAHDFNNLLTIIMGHAQMMELTMEPGHPFSQNVNNIAKASKRAANLTRQLLLFSRKESMVFKPLDLNRVVHDLLKMLKRLIGEDISVETKLAKDLWTIEGDEGNLEQVITNLAVNTRDAMFGGGTFCLKTENRELSESEARQIPDAQAGKSVCLMASDTGTGMDKDTADKIFDPFFTTKEVGKGTGMGLSVVYGIVKKHEGWINVYSEIGKGTTFKIYFPAKAVSVEQKEHKEIQWNQLQGNGERILFIEDEPDVRQFGKEILEQNGYQVDDTGEADQAIEQFKKRKGQYDLIVSDVVLPGMDGVQLVEKLHAIDASVPVIMSSGYTEERSQKAIIEDKNFPFVQKPFHIEQMLSTIKETLKSKK